MKIFIYIISFLFVYSGYSFYYPNFTNDDKFPDPEIKCGVAKISGRLGFPGVNVTENNIYQLLNE
ncbi:MAG: hypothetical protein E6767_05120 [Dysgonomonas sp.]|nr:hypothetical protein [Dysgonomonas sp.]